MTTTDESKKLLIEPPTGLKQLDMPPRLLLGPGPSNANPRVLRALSAPQVGHLDPKFIELMNESQGLLRYAFQTNNPITIPVSGCGSAAMEATFANLIEPGDKVLIAVAGYFGLRMVDMAKRYDAVVVTINKPWGENFTFDELRAAVEEHQPKVLGCVHADTSTGCLQPLDGVGDMCHANNCLLIADTVTSLGGLPVLVDEWGIDACYSGSQKCLSVPPGIAPLTMSPKAMETILARKVQVKNWYLDLTMVGKYWGPTRTYHHTAPISMNYALREGLMIIAEEGLAQRWARHRRNAEMLWTGLEAMGLKLIVPKQFRLPSLTTVAVPDGVDAKAVQAYLLSNYNIEIGGGLGELAGKAWRIGLMGHNSRPETVLLCLAALKDALQQQQKQ